MYRPFFILLFTVSFINYVNAQRSDGPAPTVLWQKAIGGMQEEICNDVMVTPDSFVLAAGSARSNDGDVIGHHGSTDSADAWLVKLDALGNIVWQLSAGGSGTDVFKTVVAAAGNNYLCFGYTQSSDGDLASTNTGGRKGWVVKVSANGDILSSKVYDSVDNGILTSGGIVLFGSNTVLKLDDTGNIVWQHNAVYAAGTPGIAEAPANKVVTSAGMAFDIATGSSTDEGWSFQGTVRSMVSFNNTVLATTEHDEYNYGGCIMDGSFQLGDGVNHVNNIDYKASNSSAIASTIWHTNYCYSLAARYGDGKTTVSPLNGLAILPDNAYLVVGDYFNGYDSWFQTGALGVNGAYYLYGGDWEQLTAVDYFPGGNEYLAGGIARTVSGVHCCGAGDFWIIKLQAKTNSIAGKVFMDLNNNNVQDTDEPGFDRSTVLSRKTGTVTGTRPVFGNYINRVDTGSYNTIVQLQNMPHYTVSPSFKASTFSTYGNADTINFAVQKTGDIRDYEVSLIPLSQPRPGFPLTYRVSCINKGTDTLVTGQVRFVKDPHLDLVQTNPLFDAVSGDTLFWNINNLLPGDGKEMFVDMTVNASSVATGDSIVSSVFIDTAGDGDTSNNSFSLKQFTSGSFDPNDKYEVHGDYISLLEVQNNQYLTYTIRFQNTGNDTAFNIFLRDTLDSRLQWPTVEVINANHPYNVKVKDGRYVECTFQDIRLVDSLHNEPASHGYITYRIKPKNNLVVGDIIHNTASIYFDFNAPVQTNTQKTTVIKTTATWTGAMDSLWDNPGNWNINVVPDGETVVVIPANVPHYPVVNINAVCFALRVDKNAMMSVKEGYNLDVIGK